MGNSTSPYGQPVISLSQVGKRYGNNEVLRDIDLELYSGKCLGLVGENGAGKSTLVGVLSGKTSPTTGAISSCGSALTFRGPREARQHGIQIIPQELAYLPDLTVAENLMLANWPDRKWLVTQRDIQKRASEALERLGFELALSRKMTDLALAERQLVEIAKALMGDARLLILDEPTASLHASETEMLLERLKVLKAEGVSLIYVSHHLSETFEISDEIAVLRNGSLVSRNATQETSIEQTVTQMLGSQELPVQKPTVEPTSLEPALSVDAWTVRTKPSLTDCSFTLHRGEVLGLFGLVGSGAETVARGLGGQQPGISGTIELEGIQYASPQSPKAAKKYGIAYVPAERKSEGLALEQPISEHLTLSLLKHYTIGRFWVRREQQDAAATQFADDMAVKRGSIRQNVGELSGGNQQKVLVGSRLAGRPSILVLHEPTRGVDIGSRNLIHENLRDYAREGKAVLIVTSDVQEAIDATDRLLVFRDGEIVDELSGPSKHKSNALAVAAGGMNETENNAH